MKLKKLFITMLTLACIGAIGIGFAACETEETGKTNNNSSTQQSGGGSTDNPTQGHTHVWGEGVITTPAGCETKGEMTYACACGETYVAEIEATGHNWDDGVITTPAGCETKGEMTYTCACGETYTAEIEATGHNYTSAVTAPTCTKQGHTTYFCTCCWDSYVTEYVEATGHSYTNYVSDNNATCTVDGTKTAYCDNGCGTTDTVVDEKSATGHTWDNGVITTPAGCETKGEMTYACACGETYTEEIEATGHSFVDKVCEYCSTKEPSVGLKYALNTDGISYSVTGIGTCTDTEIAIPSTYNNLPVTTIGYQAFFGCRNLKEIVIPDSVTSIDYEAFYNCISLKEVVVPDSVTSIGESAFIGCISLTEVVIPDRPRIPNLHPLKNNGVF